MESDEITDDTYIEGVGSKKSITRKVKDFARNYTSEQHDRQCAQVRAKFLNRWAQICGVEPDENGNYDHSKIDYENKWVKIEWYMCDPAILFKLGNTKTRDEGRAMLPEDCRETYFETGPENDRPYCEVYTGKSKIKAEFRKARAKKR